MPACSSCSATVKPEWNFCIFCGEPTTADAPRPQPLETPRTNLLAVLALILAAVGGAPALIFGHISVRQIKETGERGLIIARIATVLGYVWLVVWTVVAVSLFTNAN